MGFGDEIMALGQAQRLASEDALGRRVAILDRAGVPRWHEVWATDPAIMRPEEVRQSGGTARISVRNGPGCRPYIEPGFSVKAGMKVTDWRARDHRATLRLPDGLLALGVGLRQSLGKFLVIGPDLGPGASPNKRWGRINWRHLCERLRARIPEVALVRFRWRGSIQGEFPGAVEVGTDSALQAAGYLSGSAGYVGIEGGMHHAAAALGVPAVVIFGGFISPETTGYPEHRNLVGPSGKVCGSWLPCPHCEADMGAITPERVEAETLAMLAEGRSA